MLVNDNGDQKCWWEVTRPTSRVSHQRKVIKWRSKTVINITDAILIEVISMSDGVEVLEMKELNKLFYYYKYFVNLCQMCDKNEVIRKCNQPWSCHWWPSCCHFAICMFHFCIYSRPWYWSYRPCHWNSSHRHIGVYIGIYQLKHI